MKGIKGDCGGGRGGSGGGFGGGRGCGVGERSDGGGGREVNTDDMVGVTR